MKKNTSFLCFAVVIVCCMFFSSCNNIDEVTDGTLPYNYDLSQYVTVGDYIGVEYEPYDTTVTQKQIDDAIADVLTEHATTSDVVDRGAEMGDILNIDYVGKMNDVAFEGGTATGQEIVLGSSGYIDGFDDGLMGVKKGETVDLYLKFPDPYLNNPDYAGKDCVFTVTVNKVQTRVLPELNNDFVKTVSTRSETVAEYRQEMSEALLTKNEYNAYVEKCNSVWDAVLKNCTVTALPEKEVEAYITNVMDMYKNIAENNSMTLEEYFSAMKTDYDTAYNYVKTSAEQSVSEELVVFAIAHKEGMSISDQEYDEGAEGYAGSMGYSDVEKFEEAYGRETILKSLMWDKVVEFCSDHAVKVDEISDDTADMSLTTDHSSESADNSGN